jgi:hypothetical protein
LGSFRNPRAFDPLDLEIIDRVFEATWAQIEAREPHRNIQRDPERQQKLRLHVFALAARGPRDFDTLRERVMEVVLLTETDVAASPVSDESDYTFTV